MLNRITTVSTKGQLVIPADMRDKLGIEPGARISISLEGKRLVLEPVSEKLVDETRGLFAGGASLSKLLQQERRREKENEKW
jgi:AbrB family looped-hinge helix DNA binding protein